MMAETAILDTSTGTDWRAGLPPELAEDAFLKTIPDVPTLAKMVAEKERYIQTAPRLPKDGDPPEKWDAFYKALGRPDAPDKYEIQRPQIPEGLQYDEATEKAFLGEAHKHGLSKKQAQALLGWYTGHQLSAWQAEQKSLTEATKAGEDTLRKAWGGDYERNVAVARHMVGKLGEGGQEFLDRLESAGLLSYPPLVKLLVQVAKLTQEDRSVRGEGGGPTAEDRIKEIQRDPAYREKGTPRQRELVEELLRLTGAER